MLFSYQTKAQQVLDDLFKDNLIPFKLRAHKVTDEGLHEYRIYFYDSRLHSIIINSGKTIPINQQVSAAVLQRLGSRTRAFLQDTAVDKLVPADRPWFAVAPRQTQAKPIGIAATRTGR